MRFDVLGPLRVTCPDGPVRVPAGGSVRAVCWLVANLNHPVSMPALAEVVWPDRPGGGAGKAAALVRALVPLLGAERLRVERTAELLAPPEAVDAIRFERLVDDGVRRLGRGDLAMAEADLAAALDLWRGEPYPELDRALPAMSTIDALAEQRLVAQEELVGIALRRRVDYAVVAELRALVIRHPERVRFRSQLATALYRTGRQVEALDVLSQSRLDYGEQPDWTRLQTAILQQAPELAAGELR